MKAVTLRKQDSIDGIAVIEMTMWVDEDRMVHGYLGYDPRIPTIMTTGYYIPADLKNNAEFIQIGETNVSAFAEKIGIYTNYLREYLQSDRYALKVESDPTGIKSAFKEFTTVVSSLTEHGISLLSRKIEKWVKNDDPEKVITYFLRIFSSQDPDADFLDEFIGEVAPKNKNAVESIPAAQMAIGYLRSKNYKLKIGNYKDLGRQLIIITPDGNGYYHSYYRWSEAK